MGWVGFGCVGSSSVKCDSLPKSTGRPNISCNHDYFLIPSLIVTDEADGSPPPAEKTRRDPFADDGLSRRCGGSTNHSLRDVGLTEPSQEVDRPIASQGIEIDRRSFYALPAPSKPHNIAGCS